MNRSGKTSLFEEIKAICIKTDQGEAIQSEPISTMDGRIVRYHQTTEDADFQWATESLKLERFVVDMLWHGYSFVVNCNGKRLKWFINPTIGFLFNKCAVNLEVDEIDESRGIVETTKLMNGNLTMKMEVPEDTAWLIATALLVPIMEYDQPSGSTIEAMKRLGNKLFLMELMAHVLHPWERVRPQVQSAAAGAAKTPTEY